MQYPIFNSIIKKIQSELSNKDIKTEKFRVWKDTTIHAIGLEMAIDVRSEGTGISQLQINFDWDQYREVTVARQLVGMKKHPLLTKNGPQPLKTNPTMDVEVSWHFDVEEISNTLNEAASTTRLDYASKWMSAINAKLSEALPTEKLISRWHLDVASDKNGKYATSMCLITYFQYSLKGMDDINEIHNQISARLNTILSRNTRVLNLIKISRPEAA
jgi:hypothetical protein